MLFSLFISCPTIELAGVTKPYQGMLSAWCSNSVDEVKVSLAPMILAAQPGNGGLNGFKNLTSTCNGDCKCDPDDYIPVCGSDGLNYFRYATDATCMSRLQLIVSCLLSSVLVTLAASFGRDCT